MKERQPRNAEIRREAAAILTTSGWSAGKIASAMYVRPETIRRYLAELDRQIQDDRDYIEMRSGDGN